MAEHCVRLGDGLTLGDVDCEGEPAGERLCDGDGDSDMGEALADGDAAGETLTDGDAADEGVGEGAPDADGVGGTQCTPS